MMYEKVIEVYEKFSQEIERESYLLRAGLKEKPEYDKIFNKYPELADIKTATAIIREKMRLHEDSPDEVFDAYDRVIFTLLSIYMSLKTLHKSQKLQEYEIAAEVDVNGQKIPYMMLPLLIQRENSRDKRKAYYEAANDVVRKLTELKLSLYRDSLKIVRKDFGYPNLYEYFSASKKDNFVTYSKRMEEFLKESEDEYKNLFYEFFSDTFNLKWGEVEPYDSLYLLSGNTFPVSLKVSEVEALKETLRRGGIDLDSLSNLMIDDEVRPKKSPRAFCVPIKIPDEVVVVVKPSGSFSDVSALFHEMGHGLHFAFTDGNLALPYRRMGRVGTSEIFSFNLQYVVDQPLWLENFATGWDEKFLRFRRFSYLYYRRRYAAKVIYEVKLLQGDNWDEIGPDMYESILTDATGVHHGGERYFVDMDWGLYSADYSQAWEVEALLRELLKKEFGEGWFFNPEAYEYLKTLWSLGMRYPPLKLADKLGD